MPRRPVRAQDRKRVVRACDPCKAIKKRCDGSHPCDSCSRKGQVEACHYTVGRRHHPIPRYSSTSSEIPLLGQSHLDSATKTATEAVASPHSSWTSHNPHIISPASVGPGYVDTSRQTVYETSLRNDTRDSSSEAMGQPPVMLSSVSGEKVFVGNTAAISFLRFLQKTLERHIGHSGFTDSQESQKLFEANTTNLGSSYFYDKLSIDERKAFVQSYLEASSGLLDLYSEETIFQMLDAHDASTRSPAAPTLDTLQVASLCLMVAIGAQCQGPGGDEAASSAELFSYARKLALEKMLENPSLELIRAFLLMAFYMFGACRRNSAFMYLGVASKAADILGLHMPAQYKHLPSHLRNARIRAAKSLRVFDVVCNSILGRPSSTPSIRSENTSYIDDDEINIRSETIHRALAIDAIYGISAILDAAVTKSAEDRLNTEAAEFFVLELQQRSRNFPLVLRQPNSFEEPNNRHITIGNVHVSGAYYFSVILVTRQFLIQHIMPQLSGDTNFQSEERRGSQAESSQKAKTSHLADACIEAATFMAQMCHQVMRSEHLLGNMCIMKAWIFATGLVLGFSLLVENGRKNTERRTAFLKSLHVLDRLQRHSPQAAQYHGILSSFHVAIKAYKEQLERGKDEYRANLVDRVFLPNITTDFDEPEIITTQLPSPDMTVLDSSSGDWSTDMGLGTLGDIMPMNTHLVGGDDIIMRMLWESDRYAMDFSGGMLNDMEMNVDPPVEALGIVAQ